MKKKKINITTKSLEYQKINYIKILIDIFGRKYLNIQKIKKNLELKFLILFCCKFFNYLI